MESFLKIISSLTDFFHWLFQYVFEIMDIHISDKYLHFIVIGFIGIALYGFTTIFFKYLAKYSIELISFIFTFTLLIVITFAIEIQQYITGNGQMEFDDIAFGLFGFFFFLGIYLIIRFIVFMIKLLIKKNKRDKFY
jgi:hypothetical protein